ncbi:MAG: hypothetical protein R3D98_03695 [Candidatus Krumholzibacteriia bacterium]
MPIPIMTLEGLAPVCRGRFGDSPQTLADLDLATRVADLVAAGQDTLIVDLDQLVTAAVDEVKILTAFLWSLRTEGAEPAVVCSVVAVVDACRARKLDQAFVLAATRDLAVARLAADR